jgi:putative transposase
MGDIPGAGEEIAHARGAGEQSLMPWKAKAPVDLRTEFFARLAKGERMVDLCREYGISRKNAYKFKSRLDTLGSAGLEDQSRAPLHNAHKTSPEIVELVLKSRRKHPTWGPKKIKELLEGKLRRSLPSANTIGNILARAGLTERRKQRPRYIPRPSRLRESTAPNELWCIDYKGQFRLGDGTYCYPLTLTDHFSRFILCCQGMGAIEDQRAREETEIVFRTYGLPAAIRSDNGAPFASTSLCGLTKLSVFWMKLGISLERIRPAHPEENGRHERMHRTLKRETARPARSNLLQQQERFDEFIEEFNEERPHEALSMKRPADLYAPSARTFPSKIAEPSYPTHDDVLRVSRQGHITIARRSARLSPALAGEFVGIREEDDGRWLISFMDIDLGRFQGGSVQPLADGEE